MIQESVAKNAESVPASLRRPAYAPKRKKTPLVLIGLVVAIVAVMGGYFALTHHQMLDQPPAVVSEPYPVKSLPKESVAKERSMPPTGNSPPINQRPPALAAAPPPWNSRRALHPRRKNPARPQALSLRCYLDSKTTTVSNRSQLSDREFLHS